MNTADNGLIQILGPDGLCAACHAEENSNALKRDGSAMADSDC